MISSIQRFRRLGAQLFAELFQGSVADWCQEFLIIPPPQTENPGPFSLSGREYWREPLDCWGDALVTDVSVVAGTQTGKSTVLMGGAAWSIRNLPSGILWALPNDKLARGFSEERWTPIIENSPTYADLIPTGADRHKFKTASQRIGNAQINFVGSNSPANLASRPARIVILDEVDKFAPEARGEASAVKLAENRTKSFSNPKRFKSSSPTDDDGEIWREFMKGDQRRYFVPCPHCGLEVVFAWSPDYLVLERTGKEAFAAWDKEAKREDGKWDLDRVAKSAHLVCPHCSAKILDTHKTSMIRRGAWRPTSASVFGKRSYHISSLYAVTPQTTFGAHAVLFLQGRDSMDGLHDFVNGYLAEPFLSQDARSERIEIISESREPMEDSVAILTVDVQGAAPYFWAVVRGWDKAGNSRLLGAYYCDEWTTIHAIQKAHDVHDVHVVVDSGFNAEKVYEECRRHGKLVPFQGRPAHSGWTPAKGRDGEASWKDKRTGSQQIWSADASTPISHSTRIEMKLFQFNGDSVLSVLSRLRKGPDHAAGVRWELVAFPVGKQIDGAFMVSEEEYRRQMDAKVYAAKRSSKIGKIDWIWKKRTQRWPEHLLDCESMQLAFAMFRKRFPWSQKNPQ